MKTLVPKRRFAGFADSWEQRKLGELVYDVADGPFGSNLKRIHYTNNKEARIIQLSNISERGWCDDNIRYTTFEHTKNIKRSIVESGDLVMAKMMPAGLTIECPSMDKMYVLSSDAIKVKINKSKITNDYFIQMTKSGFFLDQINDDAQGSTRVRTSVNKVKKMDIPIPTIKEQEKIGNFFFNLDSLITLHQRKLEKLQVTKSAYLSEMFPQDGELYPKRRFAGFTDPWEQRKLEDIAEITMGQSPSSTNYTDNPDDHILVQGNADMKNGKVFPRVWTTQVTKQAYKNDLILSVRAPVGDIGKTDYDVVLGRGVAGIKGNEFLFQLLTKMNEEKFWDRLSTGSTFESINSNDIRDAELKIPKMEEQKKIGDFFSSLDKLITLHQRKLEKLQALKQAYLSEMFV